MRSEYLRFSYHRYSFPGTALKPGTSSSSIFILNRLLGIRVLYMHIPLREDTIRDMDPEAATFFFRHWLYNPKRSRVYWARHIVFFRDDLRPLCPKQMEALWRFCDRFLLIAASPFISNIESMEFICMIFWMKIWQYAEIRGTLARPEVGDLLGLIRINWEKYCTVNDFNAFFELYKRERLLKGDSSWRNVKSPCDF